MKRIWLFAGISLALASCTTDGAPPPGSGGGGAVTLAADAGSCALPDEGCACEAGSEPVTCFADPIPGPDGFICNEGARYCRNGAWGACETVRSYALDPSLAALITGPSECNPCNPDCSISRDYPEGGDLGPGNSTGVDYDPGSGGIVIADPGITTSTLIDTDGDGVPDVADDFPTDPGRTGLEGGFYHELPLGGPVEIDPLVFDIQVTTADVYFLMDTTGSMGGEINNLRASLASGTFLPGCGGGVIGAIRCTIPDAWFGVGFHDDYPISPYGGASSGDLVYRNTLDITTSVSAAQTAVNALRTHWGNDWAEGQSQALYAVASGNGLGPYLPARTGCPAGRWGYPCFRDGTIPIVVLFTDAPFHNGPQVGYNYGAFGGGGGGVTLPATTTVNREVTNLGNISGTWRGYTGRTCSRANNWNVGCNGVNARDLVFQFTWNGGPIIISLEGSNYNSVLSLLNNPISSQLACSDNGVGDDGYLAGNLAAGTYNVLVDGFWGSCGDYRLSIGVPPAPPATAGFPVTWAEAVGALNARDMRVITVESSGRNGNVMTDVNALANATGSVDSAGNPFVFSISSSGAGLGTAVVDAIVELANFSRFDVTAIAVDNPATAINETGFVQSISAVSYPAGRCTGRSGATFFQCLPGTNVNYSVAFRNNFVMPTSVPQVFNFEIHVLLDGTVQNIIPVRIVVPPEVPMLPESGSYWRDYDANVTCTIPPQRPDWGTFRWTGQTPSDTTIRFEFRTADTAAGLAAAPPATVTLPPEPDAGSLDLGGLFDSTGRRNLRPHVRVTATLFASSDRSTSPILTGFELAYTCNDAE